MFPSNHGVPDLPCPAPLRPALLLSCPCPVLQLGPGLAQHSGVVKPPKPAGGWSWVVHPVGGAAKAQSRKELREQAEVQWHDEDSPLHADNLAWYQQADLQGKAPVKDPARGPSPVFPYVAEPSGTFRALNEEEALVVADTKPKPRPRWFAGGK